MRSNAFPLYFPPLIRTLAPYYNRLRLKTMTQQRQESTMKSQLSSNSKVTILQQIIHSAESNNNNWDKSWEEGVTPWDLGQPTPILLHLHNTGAIPKGRALVPGCGSVSGHDVVAIACPERHVVGLDISDHAIMKAVELHSESPNADHFTFLKTVFFTCCPNELFDLIFDYTFFCAIEPDLRPGWANKIADLLKPDGKLITLMFPIDDHEGGPPYRVSITDYQEVLHPVGFKEAIIFENELAIAPRRGKEKVGIWRRSICQSSL